MQIIYGKTNWESQDIPLDLFMKKIVEDGFDAAELYVPNLTVPASEITQLVNDHNLKFIADIATEGDTPQEHLDSFNRYADYAIATGAILISAHTGRDFFAPEDNIRIFERGLEIAQQSNIPVAHETHRSRALYSAIDTRKYLQAVPEMRINADFSHWMNVHESDLSDQPDNLNIAIDRAIHIHARIGCDQSAQVSDPRAPEWQPNVENHINIWKRIVENRKAQNADFLTITPEFGPYPYVPMLPYTQQPVADVWEINVYMKDLLKTKII